MMKLAGIKIRPSSRLIFKVLSSGSPPVDPVDPEGPRWVNESNLGTFGENEAVVIPLSYSDPENVVTGMTITGSLPFGVQFSADEKEISGVITASETTRYDFTLNLVTPTGLISKDFYFTAEIAEHRVMWLTESSLGSLDGGQGVDIGMKAVSQ